MCEKERISVQNIQKLCLVYGSASDIENLYIKEDFIHESYSKRY